MDCLLVCVNRFVKAAETGFDKGDCVEALSFKPVVLDFAGAFQGFAKQPVCFFIIVFSPIKESQIQ